jgi:hypothetical protein
MGLTSHLIAFGLGYALGTPDGRRRVVELANRPEVKQAKEKAWDVAGDAGLAARNKLRSRSSSGGGEASTTSTPVTGAGTTASAEEATDVLPGDALGTGPLATDAGAAPLGSAPLFEDVTAGRSGSRTTPAATDPNATGPDRA